MDSIQVTDVNKSFGSLHVLDNLNMTIKPNQILCIVGPSGCGKSTLLNLLAETDQPDSGTITKTENTEVSYVFQNARLLPWKTLTQNMSFVLENKYESDDINKIISYWLKQVELQEYVHLFPRQLSGGMEQRVALARAFSVPANLLLMDEPFKGLDEPLKLRMLELVYNLWEKQPKSIVFVTHDIREALFLGHKVAVLTDKPAKIIEEVEIPVPHKDRHIGCHGIARLEGYIYSLIDEAGATRRCAMMENGRKSIQSGPRRKQRRWGRPG